METLADILGIANEFTDENGKVYKLKELTLEARAKFSRWLERRMREEAIRGCESLPADAQERYLLSAQLAIAAGVCEFGSAVSIRAMGEPPGRRYLIYLSLLDDHPDIDEETVEKLIERRMRELTAAAQKGIDEQNPKVLAALGMIPVISDVPQSPLRTNHTTSRSKKSKNSRRRK